MFGFAKPGTLDSAVEGGFSLAGVRGSLRKELKPRQESALRGLSLAAIQHHPVKWE